MKTIKLSKTIRHLLPEIVILSEVAGSDSSEVGVRCSKSTGKLLYRYSQNKPTEPVLLSGNRFAGIPIIYDRSIQYRHLVIAPSGVILEWWADEEEKV